MIPAAPGPRQPAPLPTSRWQQAWRDAVRDPRELLALLGLEALAGRVSDAAAAQFPLRLIFYDSGQQDHFSPIARLDTG